jgi:DNA-binding transcriptional LysR family regulator
MRPVGIELRHLRYFLAVSEELHFRRAAERLHMAQPPLSNAIQKLEDELGVRLFERTSRTVAPTEAGRVLVDGVRDVLASFDRAVAEARRAGGLGSSPRIGFAPWLPIERLHRFLQLLQEQDPQSSPQLTQLPAPEQVTLLSRGELDFGIFAPYGETESLGLEVEPLFAGEPLSAALPADHRFAAKRAISPADLYDEVLVLFPYAPGPSLHSGLLEQIADAGYRFSGVHEAGGMTTRDLVLAVAAGFGVALGPFSLSEDDPGKGLVVRRALANPVSMPDTVLAWQSKPPLQRQAAIAAVREIARELRQATGGDDQLEVEDEPRAA